MGKIREKIWIIRKRAIRNVFQKCVICKRYISKPPTVSEAPLPKHRVNRTAPFPVTRVDSAIFEIRQKRMDRALYLRGVSLCPLGIGGAPMSFYWPFIDL